MVRFFIVIISCFFLILYYVPKMSYYARHGEKYDEETCYRMAQVMIEHVKKRGRIETVASITYVHGFSCTLITPSASYLP